MFVLSRKYERSILEAAVKFIIDLKNIGNLNFNQICLQSYHKKYRPWWTCSVHWVTNFYRTCLGHPARMKGSMQPTPAIIIPHPRKKVKGASRLSGYEFVSWKKSEWNLNLDVLVLQISFTWAEDELLVDFFSDNTVYFSIHTQTLRYDQLAMGNAKCNLIKQQESIPVGYILPAFVVPGRYPGVGYLSTAQPGYPTPRRDMEPALSPLSMNRQKCIKALPSRNFVAVRKKCVTFVELAFVLFSVNES